MVSRNFRFIDKIIIRQDKYILLLMVCMKKFGTCESFQSDRFVREEHARIKVNLKGVIF